jgi:hypothetical protein
MHKIVFGLSLFSAFILLTGMGGGGVQEFQKEAPAFEQVAPDDPSLCDGTAGNLVMNCGFETHLFPPWVQSGDLSFTTIEMFAAHSGNWGLYTGPVNDLGFITQNVTTVTGHMYVMHIWLSNLGGTPNRIQVSWGGTVIADGSNLPPSPYTDYCFPNLPATGTSTPLRFGFIQVPSFWDFDDVIVTEQ